MASNSSRPAATWPEEKHRSGSLFRYLAHGHGTESSLKAGSHMVSSQDWEVAKKLLDALMWNLSEAVLGNMKGRKQIFVLNDNVSQPPLTLNCGWHNGRTPRGRDVFGQCILVRNLTTLLSNAVGILYVATKLDEGTHFLISCLPGPEKLRSIKSCSCTRSKLEK